MARVKKNDTVLVIAGKDKGKKGTVADILPKKGKVLVQGVNVVIRHAKARKQGDVSGIRHEERPFSVSNVMPICPSCKKPCRVCAKSLEGGKKVRVCAKCKEIM